LEDFPNLQKFLKKMMADDGVKRALQEEGLTA